MAWGDTEKDTAPAKVSETRKKKFARFARKKDGFAEIKKCKLQIMAQHPEQVGNSIKWVTAPTEYYDTETGLQIAKKYATDKKIYIKLKTNRHATINKTTGTGTVKHTIECRRQPQTRLW